ncbi:MAG: Hint domain-containing protein [Pseudomonadota bacterium]
MPAFIEVEDDDITDASFWAALNIDLNSTIDVSDLDDDIQVTLTANSITFTDTDSGTVTTYTDADLTGGSFSQIVEYTGNDGDSDVSGAVGLNASGYAGGEGDDTFVDDGALGGALDGGEGNDVLVGGTGDNNIDGGRGDDILRGGSGNNNLSGGRGRDTLFAEDGSGNLDGGGGRDTIFAGENTTFVQGGGGNDSLILPQGSTFTPFSPGSSGGTVNLPGGGSFTYLSIENVTIACFAAGTRLLTPLGMIDVAKLSVGDAVMTLDHGAQPIRWIGERTVIGTGSFAPVCIQAGRLGNDRDLLLSPQHRILLSGWQCELLFDTHEVLCAAIHLCDGDRIYRAPCPTLQYFHVMFDRHEIVFAEGARTESFYVGDHICAVDRAVYDELTDLFPELADNVHPAQEAARPFAKRFEAKVLASDMWC